MVHPAVWAITEKAAKNGDVSRIRRLGNRINMHDFESMSRLMLIACENGHTHFVEWLLNAAKVLKTPQGYDCNFSAKTVAVKTGNVSMLELLMAHTPDPPNLVKASIMFPGSLLLSTAMHHEHLHVVRYLVNKLPNVLKSEWSNDSHPLREACRRGSVDIFNWLARYCIDHKIFVQWYDLLLKAAEFCRWSVVRSLFVNFNDLSESDFDVNCPILKAKTYAEPVNSSLGRYSVLHLVINQNPNDGLTPLHKAVQAGDTRLVSELVSDENINDQDNNGDTALHHAFRRRTFDRTLVHLVDILNSNFANYSVFNNNKRTPVDVLKHVHGITMDSFDERRKAFLRKRYHWSSYIHCVLFVLRLKRKCKLVKLRRTIRFACILELTLSAKLKSCSKRRRLC